ncbi:MAG: EAL domain-containing protein [Prochlorotrichaceae cyanobacterium]|jgi:diguanylate cyclase (GGDEF)-like protein/PAS domain S-box-containing protein
MSHEPLPSGNHFYFARRLVFSVLLMLGVLGGVGLQTIVNLNRLADLNAKLYNHPFTVHSEILRIKVGIATIQRDMNDIVLSHHGEVDVEGLVQQIDLTESEVLQDFETILTQFLEDPVLIQEARQTFIDWKPFRDRVIQLHSSGQIDAAVNLTRREEEQYLKDLLGEINEIEAVATYNAGGFLEEAQATRSRTIRVTTSLLIAMATLIVLWISWMYRLLQLQTNTQAELKSHMHRVEVLLKISQLAEAHLLEGWDEAAFMQQGLGLAEELTESEVSFIHFINDDEKTIELVTWSRRTLEKYCSAVFDRHYPVTQAEMWANALRERKPFICNDYDHAQHPHKQGLPAGHAALGRFLSIPIMENDRVVMITGVGNKNQNYSPWDVETVQLISNDIWRIVQRQRILIRLHDSEQRLQEAQQLAQIGSWELDHRTQEILWSDQVFRIFELDPTQCPPALSYPFFLEQVHPDDRAHVDRAYQASVLNRTPYEIVHRLQLPDGRVKHVQERCKTSYAEDGSPLLSRGTVQDVSEILQTEEKLRQAAAVFSNTAEGVVITDPNGTIVDVNAAFTTITGYAKTEVIGQTPRLLKSGRHDRAFYETLWQTIQKIGNWRGEIWNRHKNGNIYPEMLSISRIENHQGSITGYVGVFTDITIAKETEAKLHRLAYQNPLTNLPNRRFLHLHLEQSIEAATLTHTGFALLFIDLDRFKQVNDSLGASAGDSLLEQVAERLSSNKSANEWVAHLNGDEFVVVLEQVQHTDLIMQRVQALRKHLQEPFHLNAQEIYITTSIGISCFPYHGKSADRLLKNADIALHEVKANGRNHFCFYLPEMTEDALQRMKLENALQIALKQGEFFLVYQPQWDLQTQDLYGMETLIRWYHPEMGLISPGEFIPMAEQNGLIREIGPWVLRSACIQGKAWLDQGLPIGHIAVNIAGPQIQSGDFISIVQEILDETGFPPFHLELEVTESFVMQDPGERIQSLEQLRLMGVQLAIDDFGTGYSSLSYLKQLPINKLKIDQSFVRNIAVDPNDLAIVEAIIALAKALNLTIIAEGVETKQQMEFLRERGCHQAQGYLYSRPISPEAMAVLLRKQLA